MKKINFILLSLLYFSLAGCTSIDITVRPNDYNLDYWVGETIDINGIDTSKIYEKSEERIVYLDSNCSFQSNIYGSVIFPKECARYYFSFKENVWSASTIYITDPSVKVFGLTMNSSEWEIRKTSKNLEFEYLDHYSGLDVCYSKENIEFRIYPAYISIEIIYPNC